MAKRNRDNNFMCEGAVQVRWCLSSKGNVVWDGWLHEVGTWYPEMSSGFQVAIGEENGVYAIFPAAGENYDIPQDVIDQIGELQESEIYG
jgi:hypothetical protein